MPCVTERFDLRLGPLSRRATEQHVVVGLAIERWIEIDEIHAFALDLISKNGEVVAVVEVVQSVQGINSPGLIVPQAAKPLCQSRGLQAVPLTGYIGVTGLPHPSRNSPLPLTRSRMRARRVTAWGPV